MIVTVMRHGEAGSASEDRLRRLTARGAREVDDAARQLRDLCKEHAIEPPESVFYSPWVRTLQTARQVSDAIGARAPGSLEALAPGARTVDVDATLADCKGRHVVLISHQPLVSRLIDHYTGDPGRVPHLTPGGFATMAVTAAAAGCADLLFWALPPGFEGRR